MTLASISTQRFIPSEFGADPDKVQILGMDYDFYEKKAEIRRCIEKQDLPYTYICCNFFQRYLLPSLVQPGLKAPPRDKVLIFGHGNIKGQLSYIKAKSRLSGSLQDVSKNFRILFLQRVVYFSSSLVLIY